MKKLLTILTLILSLAAAAPAEAGPLRKAGHGVKALGGKIVHVGKKAVTLPVRLVKKLCHRG